jgi:hypothetical protein
LKLIVTTPLDICAVACAGESNERTTRPKPESEFVETLSAREGADMNAQPSIKLAAIVLPTPNFIETRLLFRADSA